MRPHRSIGPRDRAPIQTFDWAIHILTGHPNTEAVLFCRSAVSRAVGSALLLFEASELTDDAVCK